MCIVFLVALLMYSASIKLFILILSCAWVVLEVRYTFDGESKTVDSCLHSKGWQVLYNYLLLSIFLSCRLCGSYYTCLSNDSDFFFFFFFFFLFYFLHFHKTQLCKSINFDDVCFACHGMWTIANANER